MREEISSNYDVVIVGCGIAGSIVGAILSSLEHRKVLILEHSPVIGGRAISFRGDEIRDAGDFKRILGLSANAWVSERSEPELSEMIKRRLLDGYVLEAGGRGAWYTNRGRVSHALAAFNKPSIFYPNVGFVWYDHQWKPHKVVRGVRYGWMTEEDYTEMVKVHKRKLQVRTIAEAEKLDRVTLKDWLQQITSNEKALEFHYAMGTFQSIIDDPALNSAGENLKCFLQVQETGVHITHGSWGFAGDPGHRFIPEGFAAVVRDNGGQIVTNAKVKEISVQGGEVTGLIAEIGGEAVEIKAPVVVSTVPPKAMLKLLPQGVLPDDFVRLCERVINTSMIGGQFGLTKPLSDFCEVEADARAFYHTAMLIPESSGLFRGNVPLDAGTVSQNAPTVAPAGKYLALMSSSVLSDEARDQKKVNIVIDKTLDFMDTAFPGWWGALEWMLFTVGESAMCWRHPEDENLDIKCPSVDGLYFAGDAFGERINAGGVESATHSGFICASAIAGKDYLEMLPPIFR